MGLQIAENNLLLPVSQNRGQIARQCLGGVGVRTKVDLQGPKIGGQVKKMLEGNCEIRWK